jgi:hypothetical protein
VPIVLRVIILIVVMLNVVMLRVVIPAGTPTGHQLYTGGSYMAIGFSTVVEQSTLYHSVKDSNLAAGTKQIIKVLAETKHSSLLSYTIIFYNIGLWLTCRLCKGLISSKTSDRLRNDVLGQQCWQSR